MQTWKDLDQQFRALDAELRHHHLEYQWGGPDEFIKLRGLFSSAVTRFEALAEIAGEKLSEVPAEQLPVEVVMQRRGAARWYEILRLRSGSLFKENTVAQLDRRGIPRGALHTGILAEPARASADLALAFVSFDLPSAGPAANRSFGQNRPSQKGANAISEFIVPSVRSARPWWRSYPVIIVGVAGLLAAIIAILPHAGQAPQATNTSSSPANSSSAADDSVIEVQQFALPVPPVQPQAPGAGAGPKSK